MISSWLLLLALLPVAPTDLKVYTAERSTSIPLWQAPGDGPLVPLVGLAEALGGRVSREPGGGTLSLAGGHFRFRVGMTLVTEGSRVRPLPAAVRLRRDSIFVPLAFVVEVLADPDRASWRWWPERFSLTDRSARALAAAGLPLSAGAGKAGATSAKPAVTVTKPPPVVPPGVAKVQPPAIPVVSPPAITTARSAPKRKHRVTIDPGHGGTDSGNRGVALPKGVYEKDVTLTVGLLLREELKRRGIDVTMTRTSDTLINLGHRAPRYCRKDCDLFVSLHVNALDPGPGYTNANGFETYFMALQARGVDAARVARMENDAARFDLPDPDEKTGSGLDFILKDLQSNDFFRQSAAFAAQVQQAMRGVHTGIDRGVKQANFAVLRTAVSPAILIELGFGTNAADVKLMTSKAGQDKLVQAIADAIEAYLSEHDASEVTVGEQI